MHLRLNKELDEFGTKTNLFLIKSIDYIYDQSATTLKNFKFAKDSICKILKIYKGSF
jgi:hypothetical protein